MNDWDPGRAPPRDPWLAIDEQARIALVLAAHRRLGPDALHATVANEITHSALHAILETQIAHGEPAAVGATLARLEAEGFTRHAALHGLMRVLAETLGKTAERGRFDAEDYAAGLTALTSDRILSGMVSALTAQGAAPAPTANRAERRAAAKKKR